MDHDSSDLINGKIHWWIHNLVTLLGMMETFGGGSSWRKENTGYMSLGAISHSGLLCLALRFLATSPWSEQSLPPHAPTTMVLCLASGPKHQSQAIMDWNCESKLIFPPFKVFFSGICHSDKSLTNTSTNSDITFNGWNPAEQEQVNDLTVNIFTCSLPYVTCSPANVSRPWASKNIEWGKRKQLFFRDRLFYQFVPLYVNTGGEKEISLNINIVSYQK
jgi:hypothetical protein